MGTAGGRRFARNLFILATILTVIIIIFTPQHMSPLPKQVVGWEFNVTRDIKVYVVPENETSLISGKEICQQSPISLLIIIHSAPENFAQRSAIRETWASHNITTVKVAFLLGWSRNTSLQNSVEDESVEFQDVIQEDFIDSYNNLTVKSVMMLKWFTQKCPSAPFLMKTDDDMFINVEHLFLVLSKIRNSQILIGTLICKAKPILDSQNKWYTPKYIYHKTYYPNYLSGTAYLMSRDVARKLYSAALSTPIIHLEDVYITGICASKAGIRPRNHPAFSYQHLGIGCDSEMITNHRLTPQQLHQVWSQRHNCTIHSKPATQRPKTRNSCH